MIKQQTQKTLNAIGLMTCAIAQAITWGTKPVWAEGSKDLVKDGGDRPMTEMRPITKTGGLTRNTIPQVYANAGEVINLGSSAVGVGTGNIRLLNSSGSTLILDCKVSQPGKGVLNTQTKETAGPLPTVNGYDACKYQVPAGGSGIYTVELIGPTTADTDASVGTIASPNITINQETSVSMWDVTVRSGLTSTIDIKGRVFTDKLALYMGGNSKSLKSELFILTDGGYKYKTDLSADKNPTGLDPNGFIFIANDRGVMTPAGAALYRSGSSGSDNTVTPPLAGNVLIQGPQHKIFFNEPKAEIPAGGTIANDNTGLFTTLGYPTEPILPAPASNFRFEGQVNNLTLVGVGGSFKFDSTTDDGYQIVIDSNNDGIYSAASGDRIIDGTAIIGANTVVWDGKDNAGNNVSPLPNNGAYPARIIMKGGEYHFPVLDAENNNGGFSIKMLNPPGGVFPVGRNEYTVFYDERDYSIGGIAVSLGCSTGCDARGGIDSYDSPRKWPSGNYGDKKAVDTWAYFPSAVVLSSVIIQPQAPKIQLVKRITKVAAQSIANYIDTVEPDDNAPGWITPTQTAQLFPGLGTSTGFSSLLQGATDSKNLPSGTIAPKPNDVIEYTIYFLSDGGIDAKNVKLCDFIPANNVYVPGSLQLSQGGSAPVTVTGATGSFYPNGDPLLTTTTGPCKNGTSNGRGGVIVNVGNVPRATASGTPTSSYGFIRFRATIQ